MFRLAIALILCMTTVPTFGQSISVIIPDEIRECGIVLLPADSQPAAAFVDKIAGKDSGKIRTLLPYSVVLVNNGSNRILAASVGFRYTDADGKPHDSTFSHGYFNAGYSSQISPGQARLFLLQRGLNVYFAKRAVSDSDADPAVLNKSSDLIVNIHTILSKSTNLSGYVDSVVLEGVGLIGPDTRDMKNHGWNRTTTY